MSTPTTALRWAGALLLAGVAVLHGKLWLDGYRAIDVIGPLFALDTLLAALLAVALVVVARTMLAVVALVGAALTAGTAGGLLLSTQVALFGFSESLQAQQAVQSLVVEGGATVVLLALVGVCLRNSASAGHRRRRPVTAAPRARSSRW